MTTNMSHELSKHDCLLEAFVFEVCKYVFLASVQDIFADLPES